MADFKRMEDESWFTVIGVGGSLDTWKLGIQKVLQEKKIGTISEWSDFTGREMNSQYHLTGNNAYADDLHFLAFSLDGLDIPKLAMFKLQFGAKWFGDIVMNNELRGRK